MKTSDEGFATIKHVEGFRAAPYLDSVGIPTIGYGSTSYEDGTKVSMLDATISANKADKMLKNHVSKHIEDALNNFARHNGLSFKQHQFDALVCFAYNLGTGPIVSPGRSLNIALKNNSGITEAFMLYCKATENGVKRVLEGLQKRRKLEAKIYETGIYPV